MLIKRTSECLVSGCCCHFVVFPYRVNTVFVFPPGCATKHLSHLPVTLEPPPLCKQAPIIRVPEVSCVSASTTTKTSTNSTPRRLYGSSKRQSECAMAALPADITWRAQAAANLLEANRRRGRIGTKKARTGCLTCKSRRIKCDEGHPLCKKCSSTGRKCSYPPLALSKRRSPSQGEQDERKDRSFVGRQLSESIGLKEKDKRTFEYFLSWAAPRLAGTLDFDFWCSQVLGMLMTAEHSPESLICLY